MTQWPPSPVYLAKDRISKKNKPANNLRVLCNYFMSRENIIKKKKVENTIGLVGMTSKTNQPLASVSAFT